MRKQFAPIILLLVCSILFTFGAAQDVVAQYSEIGIGLEPTEMTTCPNRILTASDISVEVQNLADKTRTFEVDITCDFGELECSSFNKYEHENLVLESGEKKTVDILYITLPAFMNPGMYDIVFTVTDVDTLEEESRTLDLDILSCYSVDLSIPSDKQSVCSEGTDEVVYDISIENTGKDSETFRLSASEPWAMFRDPDTGGFLTNIDIEADQAKTLELVLAPENPDAGTHEVDVFVKSTTSYAEDTAKVWLDIEECYGFNVNIEPAENTACTGRSAEYALTIENAGQTEDRYLIHYEEIWMEIPSEFDDGVTIPAGQSKEIPLIVTPAQEGTTEFEVTINSANDPEASQKVTAAVISEPCRGVIVSIAPADQSVCGGGTANYVVKVENLGTESDSFVLETSIGALEHELVTISSLETKLIDLSVDTADLSGTQAITVTVTGTDAEKIATADLIIEDCYKATLVIEPEMHTTCACSEVQFKITVTNNGQTDNFTLDFEGMKETFSLGPEESKTVDFDYAVDCEMDGTYLLTANLISNSGVSESEQVGINVKSKDACYSVELTRIDGDGVIEVVDGGETIGKGIVLILKNIGEFEAVLDISIKGPEWMYVEPESTVLGPGEETNLYVYIAPLYGTEAGLYTGIVIVDSFNSHAEIELTANVASDFVPEDNQTVEEDSVLEINTSFGEGITGELVADEGAEGPEIPMWKTLTIGIITLIIILVLLARFILLMRK